jgi:hypothetical protein
MVLSDVVIAQRLQVGGEPYNSTFVHHLITIFSDEAAAGTCSHERFRKEIDDLMDGGGSANED